MSELRRLGRRWSQRDIDLLRSWWRAGIPAVTLQKDFPGRTAAAIATKAHSLGIKRGKKGEDDDG